MEKLDNILESFVAKGEQTKKDELLGAALVVVNKDGVIYKGAAGRHTRWADSPEFSVDSFSWIASMTKIVTATGVMKAVERGLIGLDDDVRPSVPQLADIRILRGFVGSDVPYLEENTTPITLRQLLTHTAGFGYGNGDPDLERWAKHVGRKHEDLKGTLEIWNTPLKFTPGQGWYYGSGLDWAGQVIEKVTGQRLGDYLADNIFRPLGMDDTTFRRESLPHARGRLVPTSRRDAETGELATADYPTPAEPAVDSGGGGLYTTASDHAKLLQALLGSSAGDGGFLKKETVDEMFRPQLTGVQRKWFEFLTDLFHNGMVPDFERGIPLDHGLSGVINMDDSPGKRKKGSLMWAGLVNGHWFIDRESGIGASFITNVLPQPDGAVIKIWDQLERAVYSDLLPSVAR